MGNNSSSSKKNNLKKGAKMPYSLKIEFFGDKFTSGSAITGQVILTLDDAYDSPTGLAKAILTFQGVESIRYCKQKSKNHPK